MYLIRFYTSLLRGKRQVAEMGVSARATDCSITTTRHGFAQASFGIRSDAPFPLVGYLPKLVDVTFGMHVDVLSGSAIIFEGYVQDISLGYGGLANGVTLAGYLSMLNHDWQRTSSGSAGETSGELFQLAIWERMGLFSFRSTDQTVVPDVVHSSGLADYYRMPLGVMADAIEKEGMDDGSPIDIAIWENQEIVIRPEGLTGDEVARYWLPYDPERVQIRKTMKEMASHVSIEYGTGASATVSSEGTNAGFFDEWGFEIKRIIPYGNIGAAAATAVRGRELSERAVPQISALINLKDGESLPLLHGAIWPQELVRADAELQLTDMYLLPIIRTTCNLTRGSLMIEAGEPAPWLPSNFYLRDKNTVDRFIRGQHPNGGRLR